jgi:hypothetical protein
VTSEPNDVERPENADEAEFGPRGYVPPKAARRARKIVLREPMGLGWPIAAVVAGVALAVLGAVFLFTQVGPPQAPYEPVAELSTVDPRGAVLVGADPGQVLLVRAGGPLRAFVAPEADVAFCPGSKLLEGAGGTVWTLEGRLLAGPGESLAPLRVQVHEGMVYVNTAEPLPPLPETRVDVGALCARA